MTRRSQRLHVQLSDGRSRRIVFVSHCLLNENTRYLGGATVQGAVPEIATRIAAGTDGIVQMPCPEQAAWGGVTKRLFLATYGRNNPVSFSILRAALPLFLLYTRVRYWMLARQQAHSIQDYHRHGYAVREVIAVDGSPSCGLSQTIDIAKAFRIYATTPIDQLSVASANAAVVACSRPGTGLFISSLRKQLKRRGIEVGWSAHDLIREVSSEGLEQTRGAASVTGAP